MQKILVMISLIFLNVREILSFFDIDTIWLTIIINFFLLAGIISNSIPKKIFLIIAILFPLILYRKEILSIIDILLFTFLLKDVPIKKVTYLSLIIQLLALCLFFFLHGVGMLQSHTYYSPKGAAQDFGMSNPSSIGFFVYIILVNLYLCYMRKSKIIIPIVILFVSYVVYEYCLARSVLIGGIVLVLFHIGISLKIIRPFMKYVIGILPLLLYGILLYIILNLSDYLWLDNIVTQRFSIPESILRGMSPIHFFVGTEIPSGQPMDSSFMMILFNGGILLVIFFIIQFYHAIVKFYNQLYDYFPVIFSILICGLIENFFSAVRVLSVIFWILILYKCNDKSIQIK